MRVQMRVQEVCEKLRLRSRTILLPVMLLAVMLATGCSLGSDASASQENAAQAPPEAPSEIPADEPVARVAAQVEQSVVQVNVEAVQETPFGSQEALGLGSGVIYREDGYIVTNNHVIRGASEVNVAFADGSTERGEIVGRDRLTDLAVIRVDRNDLPAASFVGKEDLLVGQLTVAIGSPSGFESTVTSGIVSGVAREFPPELIGTLDPSLVDLVQTDAAISPGSSGGALVNRDGEIIGINVAYLPAETGAVNIGFAIPSDTAVSVADQLIETGEVSSPYLGVETADLSPQDAERFNLPVNSGAIVATVLPGSAADEAGVRGEDIIVALDDIEIRSSGDLYGALRDYRPGESAELTVVRDGEEQTLDITLDERSR